MRNLITMMNAMKYYKFEKLVQEGEDFQEKLNEDMNRPAYHKMVEAIRNKFFQKRG